MEELNTDTCPSGVSVLGETQFCCAAIPQRKHDCWICHLWLVHHLRRIIIYMHLSVIISSVRGYIWGRQLAIHLVSNGCHRGADTVFFKKKSMLRISVTSQKSSVFHVSFNNTCNYLALQSLIGGWKNPAHTQRQYNALSPISISFSLCYQWWRCSVRLPSAVLLLSPPACSCRDKGLSAPCSCAHRHALAYVWKQAQYVWLCIRVRVCVCVRVCAPCSNLGL